MLRRNSKGEKTRRSMIFEQVEDRRLLAADLAINVTDNDATVETGGTVVYDFEYSNIGDEATDGSLRTYVPFGTSFNAEESGRCLVL